MSHEYAVLSRRVLVEGKIFSVYSDEVAMPGNGAVERTYVHHVGAVGVLAIDEEDRVVLVRQYRHSLGRFLLELPAGLRDVAGEQPQETAVRELAEETDLAARTWSPLVSVHSSPGVSDELVQIFLAKDLVPVPEADRHVRFHEEAEMTVHRYPLSVAVDMIHRGEITNAAAVVGILAYHAGLGNGQRSD
jgi:ADP-ribose pyrophosphatase